MLESTFVFLNGIGESTERELWDQGITTWQDFLEATTLPRISSVRKHLYDTQLTSAIHQFQERNFRYFAHCLKPRDHWRLFHTLRTRTGFLDIETTGAPAGIGFVTLVGLCVNGQMTTLIDGETLTEDRLNQELAEIDLLVTFFGSGFDLPYLRTMYPGLVLNHAHFDLCFAARRLGLRGGLKHIEKEIGLERPQDIQGLDGWEAVNLWYAWQMGDHHAGKQLCEYNEADVRNLEPLAEYLYNALCARYGPQNNYHL